LRYFHDKPNVSLRRDGSSYYQHLRCYTIDDNPPTTSTSTNDNTMHLANSVKS
ncbi:unnamed protein product, partial [Adineta ricciae]